VNLKILLPLKSVLGQLVSLPVLGIKVYAIIEIGKSGSKRSWKSWRVGVLLGGL
jgi:hypothetical protein